MRTIFTFARRDRETGGTVEPVIEHNRLRVSLEQSGKGNSEEKRYRPCALVPPVPQGPIKSAKAEKLVSKELVPLVPPVPSTHFENITLSSPGEVQAMLACNLPLPTYEVSEWAEDFHRWALTACMFQDQCYGGLMVLHKGWCEWCFREEVVPANLPTFRALLECEGFTLTAPGKMMEHGFVYGLLLRGTRLNSPDPIRTIPMMTR